MAHVLIGWELGANRGHIARTGQIAAALIARGHTVAVALQRTDGAARVLPAGTAIWQAPLWPRLLVSAARPGGRPVTTTGDILGRLGLDSADTLPALIGGWERIIAAERPDAAIADFAPGLLCAARGRLPTVLVGTGFDAVPAGLNCFPPLVDGEPAYDEARLLDTVNTGLRAIGREPLSDLPAIFAADRVLAGTFAELDAHAGWRTDAVVAPSVARDLPKTVGGGEELFVYASEIVSPGARLWDGLAASGLPVRVHVANAAPAVVEKISGLGMVFESNPLPFDRIAARSRLLLSNGGNGFVSSALAVGLPQVIAHYDLEKRVKGERVTGLGLGGHVALGEIQVAPFAASLRAIYEDQALAERARAAAPGFRARLTPRMDEVAADAVEALPG